VRTEITVLIPARNGAAFIADAIESVVDQSFPRWRLVISDDASTDATLGIIRRYLSDTRIQLIENSVNAGLAGNWNRCLDQVTTKYFIMVCQDDLLYSTQALQKAYEIMEAQPRVPAVYCDLMLVGANRNPLLARGFHRSGLVDSSKLGRRSILQTRNAFGVALLFRSEAAQGLRYDPRLALAIDVDFSIATAKRQPIYHIPERLIGYRYHGRNQTGVLLERLVQEMTHIAGKHGIPLRPWHRALMTVSGYTTNLARQAVLWYGARAS